jgi:hypothetical protein
MAGAVSIAAAASSGFDAQSMHSMGTPSCADSSRAFLRASAQRLLRASPAERVEAPLGAICAVTSIATLGSEEESALADRSMR